ncbi:MAG: hypothetical protein KME13_17310 [Myxacorys californica WJT36-NPBG1]|jgi:orotate phosphoribosyltransferase-like protein|nr:hypothetical protein [Myxacorys californica WJT36-NPBG1]
MRTRENYRQEAIERRKKALALRQQGMTWQQVAEVLGMTADAARMLIKRQNRTSLSRCMVA